MDSLTSPDAQTTRMRAPMPLEDRAKIFVPFDPLHGFREALREKEREADAATEWGGNDLESPDA
ncbi:MAG: hypothetical protein Q4A01_10035 [Coriobacteriales bacterium]|nr:hypothetical protein [Coriobacteriales bacterium]